MWRKATEARLLGFLKISSTSLVLFESVAAPAAPCPAPEPQHKRIMPAEPNPVQFMSSRIEQTSALIENGRTRFLTTGTRSVPDEFQHGLPREPLEAVIKRIHERSKQLRSGTEQDRSLQTGIANCTTERPVERQQVVEPTSRRRSLEGRVGSKIGQRPHAFNSARIHWRGERGEPQ